MLNARHWILGSLLGLCALTLVAAPGEVSFKRDVQPIFDHHCADCHGAKKQKARLNLSPETAYQELVNMSSAEIPSILRVKPGDPADSYLWQKLEHTAKKGSGMPKGWFWAKNLDQRDMDTIKAWIEQGAKP